MVRFFLHFRSGNGQSDLARRGGVTLVELMVCVVIIGILAAAVVPLFFRFQMQAKISTSKNNQRILANAVEMYLMDHGDYPHPAPSMEDAFGVVSHTALRSLTTPVAYMHPSAFHDPFGALKVQTANPPAVAAMTPVGARTAASVAGDVFRPPTPGFNVKQSLLYFYYPKMALMLGKPEMKVSAYAVVSVGPDLKDSFIMYYPFPKSLPLRAALYGIYSSVDAVYDPTNGTRSGGDLAAFGGRLSVPRFVGGGRK